MPQPAGPQQCSDGAPMHLSGSSSDATTTATATGLADIVVSKCCGPGDGELMMVFLTFLTFTFESQEMSHTK